MIKYRGINIDTTIMSDINVSAKYKQQLSDEEFKKLMSMNCVDHAVYDLKRNISIVISCSSPVWPMRLTAARLCISNSELHCKLDKNIVTISIESHNPDIIYKTITLALLDFITFTDNAIATPNALILYDDDNFRSTDLPIELSLRI